MKKYILMGGVLLFAFALCAGFTCAAGKAAPKATGGIGYTVGSTTQRHAEFNAIQTGAPCSFAWDVTGNHIFTFKLNGDSISTYPHDAFLAQTGNSITGSGGYPAGGGLYAYSWHITNSTVAGNTVSFSVLYDTGAPGTIMEMTGIIATDGIISGTWTDNFGGTRNGTWTSTSSAATKVYGTGCTGKGMFKYSDADGNAYTADVQYVAVAGDKSWFAGPIVSGNILVGSWIFVEVKDSGEPGIGVDQVWGAVTDETGAKTGVASMSDPTVFGGVGPIFINSGNLQVH